MQRISLATEHGDNMICSVIMDVSFISTGLPYRGTIRPQWFVIRQTFILGIECARSLHVAE